MPELPEAETIRRDIEKEFSSKQIEKVTVTGSRSIRRHETPTEFIARVEGRTLVGTRRRGKYILLDLDSADTVVAHMGMSGQLLKVAPNQPPRKHTHLVMAFARAAELRFVDPRTFGEIFVTAAEAVDDDLPELAHLGFDPIDDEMEWADFATLLDGRRTRLKPLLMDQRFVAGIGNMYADEILFAAGLRHDRSSGALSPEEIRRLYRSIVETLQEAIEHRGSSLADEQYRDLFGAIGEHQRFHNVYDREDEPCSRCQAMIVKVKANGRSTYFCPKCQI